MRLNATVYVHRFTEQDRPYFKNDGKVRRDIPSLDLNKQKVCVRFVSDALFKNWPEFSALPKYYIESF